MVSQSPKATYQRPRSGVSPRARIAAGVALFLLALWGLWPSPYGRVENLASRGATVVAFGDSLTAGYGAAPGEDYPSRLAALAGVPVINAGVSGDTTESAATRLASDVLSRNPRVVIVGLGGNDFLRGAPLSTTEANLRSIVRQLHAAGAMVVILGFRFPSLGPSHEAMYARVAKTERCLLIPDLLDGILSSPALKSDEIHPNGRGYALMAERIAGPLRRLLAKANATRD